MTALTYFKTDESKPILNAKWITIVVMWWKWEILSLEWELNPHLWHSRPLWYHCTTWAPWRHYYVHTYLSMQLLTSEVSAEYNTHPPGIVSLLMLTITYIEAMVLHIYIHRVGSTTIHHVVGTGSWSRQPVSWVWWKWVILCLKWELNPHHWYSMPVCYDYTLHSLMSPLCPRLPVYAAPCLRCQWSVLHNRLYGSLPLTFCLTLLPSMTPLFPLFLFKHTPQPLPFPLPDLELRHRSLIIVPEIHFMYYEKC